MKDKVIIITGASSGIGLALAHEFASRGTKLVLAARSIDKLQETGKQLQAKGIETLSVKTDVSIEDDCKKLIEKAIAHFGRIDILVNNAGISMRALFKDLDLSVIRRLMDVNFWGTVYCTKYALPHLLASRGSVVGIISIAGHIGLPARTGYSASKFAVRGFLDALRAENLKTGLHVLVVAPGFTRSNIRNVALVADGSTQGESPRNEKKMMSAEECARQIVRATQKRKNQLIQTFYEGKLAVTLNKFFPSLTTRMVYNHLAKETNSPIKKLNSSYKCNFF